MLIISAISYAKDIGDFIRVPLPTELRESQSWNFEDTGS